MNISDQMKTQWDEMSRQNAVYSVCSSEKYEDARRIDYELFWKEGTAQVDFFLSEIPMNNPEELNLVEIGCGLGRMTHHFASKFRQVFAVDVSAEMLKRAQNYWGHLPNVEFILGNGTDLQPIPDHSIDVVFSFLVLQHVPDPQIALGYIRECSRVLKAGGIAYLQMKTSPQTVRIYQRMKRLLPHSLLERLRVIKSTLLARNRREFPSSLEKTFSRLYPCWDGCSVDPKSVEAIAKRSGLSISKVAGQGTQYTFYTFVKEHPDPHQRRVD